MKKISIIVCVAMMFGSLGNGVSAYEISDDKISIYESFEQQNNVSPQGWIITNENFEGKAEIRTDNSRYGKVMKLITGAEETLPFNTNYSSGLMHISFDLKQVGDDAFPASSLNKSMFLSLNANRTETFNSGNYNGAVRKSELTYDQYDYKAIPTSEKVNIFSTGTNDLCPVSYYNSAIKGGGIRAYDSDMYIMPDQWNKFDILVNKDTNKYSVYENGILLDGCSFDGFDYAEGSIDASLASDTANKIIKGITFNVDKATEIGNDEYYFATTDNDKGGYYLDNVYVNTYDNNNSISIVTDDLTSSGVEGSNGKLNVAFSEYMTSIPTKENVTIKNKLDNSEFSDFTILNADNMQFDIQFGNTVLDKAEYTVTVNDITGAVTNSVVNASADFYVRGEEKQASTERFYYMDENFNSYTSALTSPSEVSKIDGPTGWTQTKVNTTGSDYGKHWQIENNLDFLNKYNTVSSFDKGNGDYSLYFTDEQTYTSAMTYYFPKGVCAGNFTTEFDVKSTNGNWSLGFSSYDNMDAVYTGSRVTSAGDATDATALNSITNRILGQNFFNVAKASTGSTSTALKVISKNRVTGTSQTYSSIKDTNGATVYFNDGVWTHITADFNLNSNVYTFYITPEGGTTKTVKYEGAYTNRFFRGIDGLCVQGRDVYFDNIKIYKEGVGLIDDDFNDYIPKTATVSGQSRKDLPGGWYSLSYDKITTAADLTGDNLKFFTGISDGDGVTNSTDNADKALKIYGVDPIGKLFNQTIKGTQPFAVEFDIKAADNVGWAFYQLSPSDLLSLPGYNTNGYIYADGVSTLNSVNKNANSASKMARAVFGRISESGDVFYKNPAIDRYDLESLGTDTYSLSDKTAEANKWYHYKLIINPTDTVWTNYKLYVKDEDGEYGNSTEFTAKKDFVTNGTAGIGFAKFGDTSEENNILVDNVNAYAVDDNDEQITSFVKEYVKGVDVEYYNGNTVPLTSEMGITPDIKRFAIHFSAPVNERLARTLQQPENEMLSSVTGQNEIFTGVYDTVEDLITLRRIGYNSNSAETVAYKGSFSPDKKTYYLTFDENLITPWYYYELAVAKNIGFESSAYSTLENAYLTKFYVTAYSAQTNFKVTDLSYVRIAGNVLIPVDNIDSLDGTENTKVLVNGYNSKKESQNFDVLYGRYFDSKLMETGISTQTAELRTPISMLIDVNNTEIGYNDVKCFVWDKNTLIPYGKSSSVK